MSDAEHASLLDCEECLQPAEAFSVIGNETRLAILEALWEAPERPVTFSELRGRVGMADSAQFNYHLQKLTGQFVQKSDDGYDFRSPGRAVIQAVLSGSLNRDPELGPFEVAGDCIDCDAGLEAFYEDERLRVVCPDCGRGHADWPFPPGGLEDRTPEEVAAAFNQRVRHLLCLSADGVCPDCNGRMETTVDYADSESDSTVDVTHWCRRCENESSTTVGISLLDDAEVVSFYRDHGVDLNAVPFWTLPWCVADDDTTVLDDDPWRLRVDVELDDERLEVVLDGELTVVDSERVPAKAADD
ncbi:winged helix-turn-helix domain-containing protein [Natronomonas marina]|jgi:hypothetical protein|uniref:winged helix-turn-helix domain-containing protein n=1 Tax=Natronomonas marina TaxID=2961939 RepID=UPI0020C975F4|nr:winged helix-turn-helix domain-containing protein [Natronomonas marina]